MALAPVGQPSGAGAPYDLIGVVRTFRVNTNGTFTPVVNITASSITYGVQFTFTMLASNYDANVGLAYASAKTGEVDAVCAYPNVVGFHTEVDQGVDQILYNFAVILIGTSDLAMTDELRIRMDHINDVATFAAIDAVWARLVAIGAS